MTSHDVTHGRGRDRGVRRPAVLVASVLGTVSAAGAVLAANAGIGGLACSGPLLIGWG